MTTLAEVIAQRLIDEGFIEEVSASTKQYAADIIDAIISEWVIESV